MIQIKRLKLRNYKKFKEKEVEFDSGLNVVFGENEMGKSTISEALMDAFFADPTTRSRKFFGNVRNWDETDKTLSVANLPKLELYFEINGNAYYLLKDFQKKEALIESSDGKQKYEGMSGFNKFVLDIFGFTSEDVYKSTGFIKHEKLSNFYHSNDFYSALNSATSQLETSENIHQILDEITEEITQLQKGIRNPAKNPGEIKQKNDLKQKLESELSDLLEKQNQVRLRLKQKQEAESRIVELNGRINNYEKLLENTTKYENAKREIRIVEEQVSRITQDLIKLEDIEAKITATEVKIEQFARLKNVDLDEVNQEIKKLNEDIELKSQVIQKLEIEKQMIEERQKGYKKDISIFVGTAFLVLGVVLAFFMKNILVGLIPVLGGIGMALWQVYRLFFGGNIQRLKETSVRLKEIQSIQQEALDKKDLLVDKYGFSNEQAVMSAKEKMINLMTNLQTLKGFRQNILNNKTIQDLRNYETQLLIKKKEIEITELTPDVVHTRLQPQQYQEKKREIELLKHEESKQQELFYSSEAEIKAASVSAQEIENLEIQLGQVKQDLEFLEKRVKILSKTHEVLDQAADDTAAMVSAILKEDMEKYLPVITNSKYDRVKINERFELQIFEKTYNRWIKPENGLSSGALDQIYFLIRLAFFKLLLKKGSLFLILDDPFVNYDALRLASTLEILKKEQTDYQILFFTNNKSIKSPSLITL